MDEILMKAAQELDRRGWCKNFGIDDEGRVCLYGAIATVLYPEEYKLKDGGIPSGFQHHEEVADHAERLVSYIAFKTNKGGLANIFLYNDEVLQTKEEAVKALMEAAEYDG